MNTRDIYLIRHGQSEGNLMNIIQGHLDANLTPLGQEQAHNVALWFRSYQDELNIKHIYSSDLNRAYNTGRAIAQQLGLDIHPKKEFREAFFGKWEGLSMESAKAEYPDEFEKWKSVKRYRPPWCEGHENLQTRAFLAIDSALENTGEGNLVIATHGGFIFSVVDGIDPEQTIPIQNCSITHIRVIKKNEEHEFEVVEVGKIVDGVQSTL